MASVTEIHGDSSKTPTTDAKAILVWLDDNAGIDPQLNQIFLTLYDDLKNFNNPGECIQYVSSIESTTPCISLLVSGRYGLENVPNRFQPLNQVKSVFVYCMDVNKHKQWAQHCSKVRCVSSELPNIFSAMQQEQTMSKASKGKPPQPVPADNPTTTDSPAEDIDEPPMPVAMEPERFLFDQNLYDQLALRLILNNTDKEDMQSFKTYCQNHDDTHAEHPENAFKPGEPIHHWYDPHLPFLQVYSNDLSQLWSLRWFLRLFHEQMVKEHADYTRDLMKFSVYHATYLSDDEFDEMKIQLGQTMIWNRFLYTCIDQKEALKKLAPSTSSTNKVIFQIDVDAKQQDTVPYTEIERDEILFWFGARFRLTKIECIENEDQFWLIGITLVPTLNPQAAVRKLFDFYWKELSDLKNAHHALGRLMICRGLYSQASAWLQKENHYEELAELAMRRSDYEQAANHLSKLPEDSHDINLLRAYLHILNSSNTMSKGRTMLTEISAEATERLVRARANIGLAFLNLTVAQQAAQAFDQFKVSHDTLTKTLPELHPLVIKALIGLGYAQFAEGNIVEAKKSFELALKKQRLALTNNHPDFAKTRAALAHCHANEKQHIKDALHEFNYALNILRQTFYFEQKYHPEVIENHQDIDAVRKGKKLRVRNSLLDYI